MPTLGEDITESHTLGENISNHISDKRICKYMKTQNSIIRKPPKKNWASDLNRFHWRRNTDGK